MQGIITAFWHFGGISSCGVAFYTSSFLSSVDTARADWNLTLPLTSASPAVIVPLFIITAAEEERGWVAQTPCLPPHDGAQHTALMCSDTTAQTLLLLLLLLDSPTTWALHPKLTHSQTVSLSHTHTDFIVHRRLGVASGSLKLHTVLFFCFCKLGEILFERACESKIC